MAQEVKYTEDNIKSLEWYEHIRLRPGMYIGKLGDGTTADDGIYVLLKEIMDNSIDEFVMGNGKNVEIVIKDGTVTVRDYGRGIPLGKVIDCVSKINTGGKYDSRAFKKSVGLNGVGTKAVNALSSFFRVESFREGEMKAAEFGKGEITQDFKIAKSTEKNGTLMSFIPDESIFVNYQYRSQHIERLLWNYCYLNAGLTIIFRNSNRKMVYAICSRQT
jgi:topoisomerase-4 subunit B